MKTLSFKNGSEAISFEELKLSLDEQMVSGKPLNGIGHVQFIEEIGNIASRNHSPVIDKIYVSNSGPSKTPGVSIIPYIEQEKGEKSIEAHVFRRLITNYEIENDNPEWNTKLAISYHQGGIDVAMGANVKICSNLSIFGYEHMATTRNMPLEKIFEVVSDWITKYDEKIMLFDNNLKTLKNAEINLDKCFQFVGLMTGLRVEKDSSAIKNYINDSRTYALNQGQISKFTEDALLQYSETENSIISGYDLYNIGTNLHKAESMEIVNIIPQNVEFGVNMLSFINNKVLADVVC